MVISKNWHLRYRYAEALVAFGMMSNEEALNSYTFAWGGY